MVDFNNIKFKGKDENFNELKGGIKRESIKDANLLNIFDKIDTDKNKILDSKEINIFKQNVQQAAEHGRDTKLSKNEAKGYLDKLGVNSDSSNLFGFINKLSQESSNVENSTVNSDGSIVTKYADGSIETIKKDGTKIIEQKTSEGILTTETKINEKGEEEKVKETFISTKDGSETITTYKDGKKVSTVKTNVDNSTETVTFDDNGNEKTKVVKNGSKEETYEYKDGQAVLTKKVEGDKTTTYTKNADGTETELIKDSTGIREIVRKNGEIIKDITKNNDGSVSEIISDGNTVTQTVVDSSGNKTIKTISIAEYIFFIILLLKKCNFFTLPGNFPGKAYHLTKFLIQ